ncbi:MAG: DUF72 domain-containing protein, partial [Sphingomicrobium sp.]
DCREPLDEFIRQVTHLREKLDVFLLQLPPKLAFDRRQVDEFLKLFRARTAVHIACEPRHVSWFTEPAADLLRRHNICRVAADPAITELAALPGAWGGIEYWRLHGSPVIYRSSYANNIGTIAKRLTQGTSPEHGAWCVFDNTASSAATADALALQRAIFAGKSYLTSMR